MAQTLAQKNATNKYRAKNGRKQINLELTVEDRLAWQSYADSLSLSCTGMVRECVRRCMALDRWMENPAAYEAQRQRRSSPELTLGIEGMEGMD
ncbi:MAG: hypothetical protein Q4C35_09250 [Eubacteriales bacterium]|nr:hypothetical protein [Eubacteriales bacterium]